MSDYQPKLFVIAAPSGAGKTTLVRRLMADSPELKFSISYTTRKQRHTEPYGTDYFFIDKQTFEQMVACRQSPNSAECQTMAFAADPTPAITMTLGPLTESVQLDCSACPNWQTFACAFQSCPAATAAYLRCTSGNVPSNDNCAAITATMGNCFQRQAVISCREVNTPRCFAP